MNHFSLHPKYLNEFFENSKLILEDYLDNFLESSDHIYHIIMNNYFDSFLLRVIMDSSNLTKISITLITLITVSLMAYLSWYYTNNKKTSNIDNKTNVIEEEFNKSAEKDDNLTETSQEKIREDEPINKSLEISFTPQESNFTVKSLQESCQDHNVVKIKDPETLSQGRDNNSFENDFTELKQKKSEIQETTRHDSYHSNIINEPNANDSMGLTTGKYVDHEQPESKTVDQKNFQSYIHASLQSDYEEISYEDIRESLYQEKSLYQESGENPFANSPTHTIIQEKHEKISYESDNPLADGSDKVVLHEPEASVQYKIQQILSYLPKADSSIAQTGLNYRVPSKTESESEVSSQSDLSDTDGAETKYEDACVQTDLKGSRSIILNDQIPVKMPLPNETALDAVDEFRLSNFVYAFSGQDLIDLEDYDEEEEIRRFLFKKNI